MTPVQLQQTEAQRQKAAKYAHLTPPSTLRREIEAVMGLAERADLHRAVDWIERRWDQEHPSREWVLGTCVWCEVDFNCRREATCVDGTGGPDLCDLHAWLLPEPPQSSLQLLRDIAAGRPVADDESTADDLEVLSGCDLITGRRLKWGGRKALEYLDREAVSA